MKYGAIVSGETPPYALIGSLDVGIGMVRGEYFLRDRGKLCTSEYEINSLSTYLEYLAASQDSEVWYRLSDLSNDEWWSLGGARKLDSQVRGCRRFHFAPAELRCELAAVRQAQLRQPNLRLLFPFIARPSEFDALVRVALSAGIEGPFGSMVELPSIALSVDSLVQAGAHRLIVGMNDLWSAMYGESRRPGSFPRAGEAVSRVLRSIVNSSPTGMVWAAGYLGDSVRREISDAGIETTLIHYSSLPTLAPRFRSLPQLALMRDIKTRSRRLIAEKYESRGSM